MRIPIILTTLLALQLTASAEPEIKGTPAELAQYINGVPKTVTVTGEAEVRVPAHRAVVSLRVTTENHSLQEAFRLNLEVRGKITEALKKQGISADRIQPSKFSSTPRFGMFSDKAKSYRVENVVRVTVLDENEFQAAAGTVDAYPEVQYGGVEFEYADKEVLKQQAVAKAIDNAKERAKAYEDKLTLKLTPVSFGEGIPVETNAAAANYANGSYFGKSAEMVVTERAPSETEESVSSFGELLYTATVNIEYSVQAR